MRITGGTLVGRKIDPPLSLTTRPMMDRVRQALFNILAHHDWGTDIGNVFAGKRTLDAFCGTGALAYEALSWGSAHATLFDKDQQALLVAAKNAKTLGLEERSTIVATDALRPIKAPAPCQLLFLAPPYRKNLIPPAMIALERAGWMAKHALIVAETAKKETLALPTGYTLFLSRTYGEPQLHFIGREK